jgi:AraC-like DNA-binding protein
VSAVDPIDEAEWHFGTEDVGLLGARYVRQSFPRHYHDGFVVCVNERGAHASWYAGSTVIIPEGTVCVVPPGEVHTGHPVPRQPWHYRAMYPSAAAFVALGEAVGLKNGDLPVFPALFMADAQLADRFVRGHRRLETEPDALARDALVGDLLMAVLQRHAIGARGSTPMVPPVDAVRRAVEYIHDHSARPITLQHLAAAAGVSRYAILRAFRRSLGMPPYALVTQVRVEHAKRLLRHGVSIASASHQAGFADQSHMTRHFKRLLGVTPGAFARAVGGH